jgi:hypothetical protein
MLKRCQTIECQNKLKQSQWKEHGKEDRVTVERRDGRGFKNPRSKERSCSGQGSAGMEDDCIASQGPQRTIVLEKKIQAQSEENKCSLFCIQ